MNKTFLRSHLPMTHPFVGGRHVNYLQCFVLKDLCSKKVNQIQTMKPLMRVVISDSYLPIGILPSWRRHVIVGVGSPPTLQWNSTWSLDRAVTSSGPLMKNGLTARMINVYQKLVNPRKNLMIDDIPWTLSKAGGDSRTPTTFSAMHWYRPSSLGRTSVIIRLWPVRRTRPNPVWIFSPFLLQEMTGSGKPRGGAHSMTAVSPAATLTFLGITLNSSLNTGND